jgi:hypothetical protein
MPELEMMSCTTRPSLVSTVLSLAMAAQGTSVANADPPAKPDRRAAAAELFQQGINDLQAGKTAEGCDKLAESVATVPDSGAMGALAECDTALGRLSEAWELWRDLSTSAPTAELRDDAMKNAAALDKRLSRVAIHLRGTAPSNLVVTLNGKPVSAVDATQHRVTPGTLVVVAASPEIEPWTQTLNAKEGATIDIEIPVVESQNAMGRRKRGRLVGLSIVGAGAIVLGIGAVYGGTAYADWRSAADSCGGNTDHCKGLGYASAQSDLASARRAATISSWTTAAGVGVAAAGLLVYLSFRHRTGTESATAWRASPMTGSQRLGVVLTRSLP